MSLEVNEFTQNILIEYFEEKEAENVKYLAKKFFDGNEFGEEIWKDNYKVSTDKSVLDTLVRVAFTIFKNNPIKAKKLLYAMLMKKISFGGRIYANVGTDIKLSFFNCYSIQRTEKPYDSMKGIFSDLEKVSTLLKEEGGVGIQFNHLRPRGTFIKGVGVSTPGAVEFMKLYSKSSEIITKGNPGEPIQYNEKYLKKSKIRKGAMIALLDVRHPDIEEFITAKQHTNNGLEMFNISVIIPDAFMKAVENDDEWDLWFPDIHFKKYDEEWNGDFDKWEAKGYPKVIYKTVKAKELWNLILKSMYNRAEPGLLFIDNANKHNNLLPIGMKYVATNPCGEVVMSSDMYKIKYNRKEYTLQGDICNLGHLNLVSFVKVYEDGKSVFDFEEMEEKASLLVEALDNLIDMAHYPFPELENSAIFRRKIGCGVLGYGSMLMMLGLRYGSEEANKFTEKLLKRYINALYKASALLAKEKGAFLLYSKEVYKKGGYINNGYLFPDTKVLIRDYGLRNSALSTTAPTGNTSIFQGLVSGGVEPVFSLEYYRWANVSHKVEEELGDKYEYPEFWKGEYKETKDFKWDKQGDEPVLMSTDGKYLIDKTRGLCKKVLVRDYALRWLYENFGKEKVNELKEKGILTTALELSVEEHMKPFIIFSKIIDQTISKTVNIPNDYDFSDFNDLFFNFWKQGGKGITVYRAGTMTAVLETDKKKEKPEKKENKSNFYKNELYKKELLPEEDGKRYIVNWKGIKIYINVVHDENGYPLELYAQLPIEAGYYNGTEDFRQEVFMERLSYWHSICRLISMGLRYGLPLNDIIKQLRKSSYNITHLSGILARILSKYPLKDFQDDESIEYELKEEDSLLVEENNFGEEFKIENTLVCPICGSKNYHRIEGCMKCLDCGYSKCQ